MDTTALTQRIAFSMLRGMTPTQGRRILDRVGSVERFFELSQAELWQQMGTASQVLTDAERRRVLALAANEAKYMADNGICGAFIDDGDYPTRLSQCNDAPLMLYTLGEASAIDKSHMVAVVGTRNATTYGADFVRTLVNDLARTLDNVVIVSGLAYGIDVLAHKAALSAGIPTVAVVAHGLSTVYPADHRDIARRMCTAGGAMVSEYHSSAPVHKGNFLARNRIVAGMCDAVIVVESDTRGGALSTARLASAYDRQVCAVPGRVTDRYSRGCNALIYRNVASAIRDAGDLIDLMGWSARPAEGEQQTLQFAELTPEMQVIVDHLRQHPESTINEMVEALGIPYPSLSARVMEMEMEDILTANPGGTYSLNI